jgi:RNA-directed DNA polymerase
MTAQSPRLYYQQGREKGVPDSVIRAAVRQQRLINATGSKAVLSLKHLAVLTGASPVYLRKIVQRDFDPYLSIERRKRSGSIRLISAPEPVLMNVQRWILDNALVHARVHPSSFAYSKGSSIRQCAEQHLGARWMIKLDLLNFFGTIDEGSVYRVFRKGGYSSLVAFELARISTRSHGPISLQSPVPSSRYTRIPSYTSSRRGVLPQGGPASGLLANALMFEIDEELTNLADNSHLAYTRYSDDLAFSTDGNWSRPHATAFIKAASRIINRRGFRVNPSKTVIVPPGARHIVLGLLVDDQRVRLMPEFRRRLQGHVRGVSKFGLIEHVRAVRFRSLFSFISFIEGHISYAQSIDSQWASKVQLQWHEALTKDGYPLSYSQA